MGYKLFSEKVVSHVYSVYMDDLKLFGRTHSKIESLLHTVKIFSADIKMSFVVDKRAYMKRGKVYSVQDIELCNGESIRT